MTAQHYEARRLKAKGQRANQPGANNPTGKITSARYHSALAMEAAKKMRRSRQKYKTGHLVCYHLQRMLESTEALPSKPSHGHHEAQYHLGF